MKTAACDHGYCEAQHDDTAKVPQDIAATPTPSTEVPVAVEIPVLSPQDVPYWSDIVEHLSHGPSHAPMNGMICGTESRKLPIPFVRATRTFIYPQGKVKRKFHRLSLIPMRVLARTFDLTFASQGNCLEACVDLGNIDAAADISRSF